MNRPTSILLWSALFLLAVGFIAFTASRSVFDDQIVAYTVDPKAQDVQFYWKNDKGELLKSIQNLKNYVEQNHQTLLFAMNGGMFDQERSPKGLFIQDSKTLQPLDTAAGNGNFYLKPNGVFYITVDDVPVVCKTSDFIDTGKVKYATQSGPMLVVDGQVHPAFQKGSTNLNIRNGVGILPDNRVIFAMSKKEINFYNFATYFQNLGCKNALYLDGFVSRAYCPEQHWVQMDGDFGVMIGVTKQLKK